MMKPPIIIIVIALLMAVGAAILVVRSRRQGPQQAPIVGGIYSTNPDEHGKLGVIKVLAVDRDGVHVSVYKNSFSQRPTAVDESKLEFGTIRDAEPPGIMHVPLSNAAYTRLGPVFIQQSHVTSAELEPVKEWLDGGGYWP